MTVQELYNSVAQLGFETSLEDDQRFIFAANRALLQVNSIRPATKTYLINHKPLVNQISNASFSPQEKTSELYFYADNVKSYYFEADGTGTLAIEMNTHGNGEEWKLIKTVDLSSAGFKAYRGFIKDGSDFIKGRIRLRFYGDYVYTIKNVAVYEDLFSNNEKDIPAYEPFTRYDISALTSDFLSLATPPIIESEGLSYLNQGYGVENGRVILLPYDKKGVYKVTYKKKPKIISMGDNETVDLDDELCALLPMLIASYILLEDEPEKAQYYSALYNERAIDIERRIYNAAPIPITTNGW